MTNNEAIRRLLFIFQDASGLPLPGAPGGPIVGTTVEVMRHVATGPNPVLAYLLAPADDRRVGGVLRNLDAALTVWYGSDPTINDTNGGTLFHGENIPINSRGPIYIYCLAGAPLCEFAAVVTA